MWAGSTGSTGISAPVLSGSGSSITAAGSPHDHTATEAHDPHINVFEPGPTPRLHRPRQRISPVVLGDVGTEEAAHVEPLTSAGQPPPGWEHQSGVEPPPHPPEAARRCKELEAGHRAAGLHHPSELDEGGLGIIDIPKQIGEGQ